MWYRLKRHPIAVRAHFRHSLVLTYACAPRVLQSLLPPGLALDTYRDAGFLAIAMVDTVGLRPTFLPRFLGRDFFLAGYRIFARHRDSNGRTRRGLRILRSDTNRRTMTFFGNLLTHYNYRLCDASVRAGEGELRIDVRSTGGEADLSVVARRSGDPAPLPPGSPFLSHRAARRFAGPLPYTFDYEPQTHSIVRIKGVRDNWDPRPVAVEVLRNTFIERPPFGDPPPVLASAFLVEDIEYRWLRGVRDPLGETSTPTDVPHTCVPSLREG